nr:PREDICTED: uncharacterized protein LOC105663330 [Megachile rotundata]
MATDVTTLGFAHGTTPVASLKGISSTIERIHLFQRRINSEVIRKLLTDLYRYINQLFPIRSMCLIFVKDRCVDCTPEEVLRMRSPAISARREKRNAQLVGPASVHWGHHGNTIRSAHTYDVKKRLACKKKNTLNVLSNLNIHFSG